jgi:hypothetical protein
MHKDPGQREIRYQNDDTVRVGSTESLHSRRTNSEPDLCNYYLNFQDAGSFCMNTLVHQNTVLQRTATVSFQISTSLSW